MKKKTNKKKKLRKASNNFFQVLSLLWEPFYFRQKFWLFWIIIIKKMVTSVAPQLFFQCLHLCFVIFWLSDYFSSWEFRRLIPFCPCLMLTHATSWLPVFWATHVNRKWSFFPHQIFIPLPDNVTALSYIIAWPRCWNGRSTSAGHVC